MLETLVALLAATAIAVPISRRLGFGSILGYLIAGVVIGPSGLRLVTDVGQISSVAELGVVMLLFLIGLELRPHRLWVLRKAVFGLGLGQMIPSTAVLAGAGASCRGAVDRCARAGGRSGLVLHRDRAADAGGAGIAADHRRPRQLRRAAVSGHGVHPPGRAGAAAVASRRSHDGAVGGG